MVQLDKDWQIGIGAESDEKAAELVRKEAELRDKQKRLGKPVLRRVVKVMAILLLCTTMLAAVSMYAATFINPANAPPALGGLVSQLQRLSALFGLSAAHITAMATDGKAVPGTAADPKIAIRIAHLDAGIDLMEREQREAAAEAVQQQAIIDDSNRRITEVNGFYASTPNAPLKIRAAVDANYAAASADLINATRRLKELGEKHESLERRIRKADAEAQALDGKSHEAVTP
jgi:hypothetical protein